MNGGREGKKWWRGEGGKEGRERMGWRGRERREGRWGVEEWRVREKWRGEGGRREEGKEAREEREEGEEREEWGEEGGKEDGVWVGRCSWCSLDEYRLSYALLHDGG